MPRRAATASLLALLALGGCKTAQTLGERPWAFACPPAGAAVSYDDGRRLMFEGPDPADETVCLARTPAGAQVRLVFGMVEEGASEGRGHRAAMGPLFPARSGSNVAYTADLSSPGSGIQYRFDTRWRLVKWEAIEVPAGRFNTLVFERAVQGTGANAGQNFKLTYYVEGGTGVVLKRTVEVGRGGSTLIRPFQAVKFSYPPPP
ncbi:MAG: hypothetical protein K2X74_00030, partial [Acetobacteraceae bacterium]|nr:hypothetical protein [Acetobacteraceae bacterium]